MKQRTVQEKVGAYGNKPSFHSALNESLVPSEGSKKFDVRRHPNDPVLIQSLPQYSQRLRPIPTMYYQLCDHRIVIHANLRTLSKTLFQSDGRLDISN